ncbi:hypothetical protein KC354_g13129 [Hortaea werneckii]|nr:hypothetical protein KC354_g13129 [Hortaea werneckii]
MHNLIHLALLALTTTSTLAVEFKFRRFSQPDCNEKFHIAKDTHLHDPHCKTFDHHEPPFESFKAIAEEHQGDVREKFCEVVVFDQPECKGKGYTMAGETNPTPPLQPNPTDEQLVSTTCGNPFTSPRRVAGRSVRISCSKRAPDVGTFPPTSSSVASSATVVGQHTVTVHHTKPATAVKTVTEAPKESTTTITLVPQAKSCDCD